MDLSLTEQVFISGGIVAILLGIIVSKTNFCTMGAVSDWVNMGSMNRMRAWALAMVTAILAVSIIENLQILSLESTMPGYRTENFAWLRNIVGGLIFGIGMTFASGCGNKALIRLGAGNLKSIFVIFTAGFFAYLMSKTSFYEIIFHPWVSATTISLSSYSIASQDLGGFIGSLAGLEDLTNIRLFAALVVSAGLLFLIFKSSPFRKDRENIIAGIGVGAAVTTAWYITGGPMGQEWIEAMEWEENKPIGVAVQAYTFINPMGESIAFLINPSDFLLISFGMVSLFGVILGSFLYAIFTKTFRVEWFSSWQDFYMHIIGATLMGIGGVLAMGCTIGQGVTGVSTLSIGSFLAVGSIIMGSAITMKTQYYKMVYEDQPFIAAFQTALVDLGLLPKSMRKLEDF
ncbi:MAG: YeeE/YedE family protein [Pseudomonadota bacterium]